ncbi:hypothetical protein FRC02_012205 [Tulasnella sp. 418]|nr:hypothetical protein FRC02_012205 [Tulasnella sp. 418]
MLLPRPARVFPISQTHSGLSVDEPDHEVIRDITTDLFMISILLLFFILLFLIILYLLKRRCSSRPIGFLLRRTRVKTENHQPFSLSPSTIAGMSLGGQRISNLTVEGLRRRGLASPTTRKSTYIPSSSISWDGPDISQTQDDRAALLTGRCYYTDLGEKDVGWMKSTAHTDCISSVAISPDGELIASGSWDNSVFLWDSATCNQIATLRAHSEEVSVVCFSSDGVFLVSGSYDKKIIIWSRQRDRSWTKHTTLSGHLDAISAITASHPHHIVSGSWDCTVQVWNHTGNRFASLKGHKAVVSSLSVSQSSPFILSGSWDKTIRVWDASNYSALVTLNTDGAQEVVSVALCSGGIILSGHSDDVVRQWSCGDWVMKGEQRGELGSLKQLALSHVAGVALSIGDNDGSWQQWKLSSDPSVLPAPYLIESANDSANAVSVYTSIALSPDSKFMVLGRSDGALEKKHLDNIRITSDCSTREEGYVFPLSDSAVAILQEPAQLLYKLNEKACNVKHCVQQVFRALRDSTSLLVQLEVQLKALPGGVDHENPEAPLDLSYDAVKLRWWLIELNSILDTTSCYSHFPLFAKHTSTMRDLVFWIHERPYFKDAREDWAQRYSDIIRYDFGKLIRELATNLLADQDQRIAFKKAINSFSEPSELVDPFELTEQLFHSFRLSKEPSDFARAALLEAFTCMQLLLSQTSLGLVSRSLAALSQWRELVIEATSILSRVHFSIVTNHANFSARAVLEETNSRWLSIAKELNNLDFIPGIEVFDLLGEKHEDNRGC